MALTVGNFQGSSGRGVGAVVVVLVGVAVELGVSVSRFLFIVTGRRAVPGCGFIESRQKRPGRESLGQERAQELPGEMNWSSRLLL